MIRIAPPAALVLVLIVGAGFVLAWMEFGHPAPKPSNATDPSSKRAAEMLDRAAAQARKGAVPFKVTCVDARSPPKEVACDGMDLLRRASARQIQWVMPDEEHETASGVRSADWSQTVFLDAAYFGDGCGQSESLTFELLHGPLRTSQTLHGIAVRRDIIC